MKSLKLKYRFETPVFLGGADPKLSAEFRLSSFKGVLRFWWRALQWGTVKHSQELHQRESEIFGSANQKIGRSKVRLRLIESNQGTPKPVSEKLWESPSPGANYLGYGCISTDGVLERPCLEPFEFTVLVSFRNLEPGQLESVQQALVALGTLGGLGSRNRRGFGSLSLLEMQQDDRQAESMTFSSEQAFKDHVQKLIAPKSYQSGLPEWTAVSTDSQFVVISSKGGANELLNLLGREFVFFRSWGRRLGSGSHSVLNEKPEQNFKDDHHLFKTQAKREAGYTVSSGVLHPKRVAFGLPHNYGKNEHVEPAQAGLERRGSPLFFHIGPTIGENTMGVVSYLPARFLPGDRPQLQSFGKAVDLESPSNLSETVIHFLNRLDDKHKSSDPKHNKNSSVIKGERI